MSVSIGTAFVKTRDYEERVYAGVLGKIIGVYLGRPFEGWSNERIETELGEIRYYVHDRLSLPLVVTDDDISGTFTFIRALSENGNPADLSAAQIGDWWLNSVIQNRSIFWWGGMAMSTENTAYLRLKSGMKAPVSGSIATNGRVVAEQIGAQIFIDGWGMVCPGDPERAADLAGKAASVSHDGEARYGAQIIAALIAQAFVEPDLDALLNTAASLIPRDAVLYRLMEDVREWAAADGDDWRATLRRVHAHYGYDKFPGACHVVPNHALVLMGLLHGNDDFQRSLMITNTAGWDTDCNSANVGCILGVKNGLAAIDAGPDWRGPVADRLFLPSVDGARCITDALREAYALVNIGRALRREPPIAPKEGARFHFSLPGSVQGFPVESDPSVHVENRAGKLSITFGQLPAGQSVHVGTRTFLSPSDLKLTGYTLAASPTLYSAQRVRARVEAPDLKGAIRVGLYARAHAADGGIALYRGEEQTLRAGGSCELAFSTPDSGGQPFYEVGIEATADGEAQGTLHLDWLTWDGTPTLCLRRPEGESTAWQKAWISGLTHFYGSWVTPGWTYRAIQDEGLGIAFQGEWDWADYTVSVRALPHLAKQVGLIACARGLRRYVGLVLDTDRAIRLILRHDDTRTILARFDAVWEWEQPRELSLTVGEGRITARVDGETRQVTLTDRALQGAIGLLVEAGHAEFGDVYVHPHTGRGE